MLTMDQVEFYFSDSNLPHDKFLLGEVGGSQNRPVKIEVIHRFKRMRHFQPFEAVVEALRQSTFLELTDDDTSIRRKEPLPESLNDGPDPDAIRVFEDRAMPRSVYVKGFGEEVPSTQFDIEAFFAPYGPTNAVRLRRTDQKLFKGSVFVEFETEELAKAFLELDPKPKYKGKDLQIMSKKEYCEKKVDDIKAGRVRPNNNKGRRDDRGGRDGKRKRDEDDNRDWRTRREEDRKRGFRDDKKRGPRDRDSRGGWGGRGREPETDEKYVFATNCRLCSYTNALAGVSRKSSLRQEILDVTRLLQRPVLLLKRKTRKTRTSTTLQTMWSQPSKTEMLMLLPTLPMRLLEVWRPTLKRLLARSEPERTMMARLSENRRKWTSSLEM